MQPESVDREVGSRFIERFDLIVDGDPGAVAIEHGSTELTYEELRDWSYAIARFVDEADAGQVVGLHLHKSADLLAAVLGVWRAGRAWVPISPDLSATQQQFLADDCDVDLVLSSGPASALADRARIEQVRAKDAEQVRAKGAEPFPTVWGGELAYVLYTSGTTGTPRGVEVGHGGITNLLDCQIAAFGATSDSRCLWFYPPSFDASVSDWGVALMSGGTLVIDDALTNASGPDTLAGLEKHRITHADLAPALVGIMPEPSSESSLRTIVVGGEVTEAAVIRRWAELVRLANVYGPTEATVCTSIEICSTDHDMASIGRPMANVEYRVVDRDLNDVPANADGELLISGPCVALGYRNQPELTNEKFPVIDGTRHYRTGDRVRQLDDGRYLFHGRIDRQVSVNGFRIEPEEIEATLNAVDGVTGAAVLFRRLTPHSRRPRLVAVIEGNSDVTGVGVRAHLQTNLPPWKQPQVVHVVDILPRTPSGKPDLTALRDLDLPAYNPIPTAELDGTLKAVVEMVREVLEEPAFGPDDLLDDFGADSLDVVRLHTTAADRGLDLPMWLAARSQTPRSMASVIADKSEGIASHTIGYRSSVDQLAADTSEIRDRPRPAAAPTRSVGGEILVTGATGFFGARIVSELLERTSRQIRCVVRGRSNEVGSRLLKHFHDQEIDLTAEQQRRLITVPGDISLPWFGIDTEATDGLATVVHCAADLSALANYGELRASNVLGAAHAHDIAQRGATSLHHASTLSVFVGTDAHRGQHIETSTIANTDVFGGYAQSKLAAELVLGDSPTPDHIYRLGLLGADSRTGVYPANDLLTLFVRGLLRVGVLPELDHELRFDLVSCDRAARAMAAFVVNDVNTDLADFEIADFEIADAASGPTHPWHIAGATAVTSGELFSYLHNHTGVPIVPLDEFWQRFERDSARSDSAAIELSTVRMSLMRWTGHDDHDAYRPLDLFQSTEATFDCELTRERLESFGVDPPNPGVDVLDDALNRLCHDAVKRDVLEHTDHEVKTS